MDGNRFDNFTRLLSSGTSRRSILKGLLGLGGAAATGSMLSENLDARTIGTRPTIPPPTTRPPAPPTTTTPAPCPGQEQCPNSTLCCPTGTCARSGNQAICCDGTAGHGDTVCGFECCDDPLECCDSECCPSGSLCMARVYNRSDNGYEEHCCPTDLTCDGGCCDGDCYNPVGPELVLNGFPISLAMFERECCPPSGSVCQGTANAVCCDDLTEQCCVNTAGVAVCAPIEGCCEDIECLPLPPNSDDCTTAVCGEDHRCQYPSCPDGQQCCVNAPEPICLDVSVEGVCCTTPHCENGCEVCEATICVPLCVDDECCMAATDPAEWYCLDDGGCCFDSECGEGGICCAGDCLTGPCCEDDDCDGLETCCVLGELSFCLDLTVEDACCRADQCPPPSGECLVAVCTDFQCGETGDPTCCDPQCGIGQRCCPAGYCIPFDRICCNALTEVEDCPAGYACCGGFCQLGECCTGIADDGRCGTGNTCCFDVSGNFCVEGESCTTTTTSPPTTTSTAPPTTEPPTTQPPQSCAGDFCDADGACCALDPYCNASGSSNACANCRGTFSSGLCEQGTGECCPGLACNSSGVCFPCVNAGATCLQGQICCGSEQVCPVNGQCPNPA